MHGPLSLRPVTADDEPIFYAHQNDPEASAMAAFPIRERAAHAAHWARILANPRNCIRTILLDGALAGNIGAWDQDGARLVGYWIGRAFWGRGVASRALALFLAVETTRPLDAFVAEHNRGSIRVLEKNGFVKVSERAGDDGITEWRMRLG